MATVSYHTGIISCKYADMFFYNYVIFYPKTCQESHCNGCIPQSMATCNPTMASRLYQLVTCCALARLLQLLG